MSEGVSVGNRSAFRRALLRWYDANHRDLPWRHARDPYRIWISEVMLQQTRVAVVIERYQKFLRKFPSLRFLAQAQEESVLAAWSGLGYYRRARNLHAAAKVVARAHRGKLPASADELRSLPGIGRYTAAAIASITFGEPVAVVDGNVERVLSRAIGKGLQGERVWSAAQELLDPHRPGDFNQAMMELGATVCLPAQPRCRDCPVRKFCRTQGRSKVRASESRQRKREVAYLLARRGDAVLLVRRPANQQLMPGMWELPEARRRLNRKRELFSMNHSITVTSYKVNVIASTREWLRALPPELESRWVTPVRLSEIPLTGLARKILRRAGVMGIQ